MRKAFVIMLMMLLVLGSMFASGNNEKVIRLMDASWTEQKILSQLFIHVVEGNTDYKVDYKDGNGGAVIALEAFRNKEVDIVPSHTGSQLTLVFDIPFTDEVRGRVTEVCVDEATKRGFKYVLLGYENNYAALVRRDFQEKYGFTTVSELVTSEMPIIGAASNDIYDRDNPINWKNFVKFYDLKLTTDRQMDWGLMHAAIAKGELDLIIGESANGYNIKYNLVELKDDKHFWPPYEALYAYWDLPEEVIKQIERLSVITSEDMSSLMYRVIGGEDVGKITKEYLLSKGIIK